MKRKLKYLLLTALFLIATAAGAAGEPAKTVPVKGMVTMVDLGATRCIPCKMMAPILQKLEKRYAGKAALRRLVPERSGGHDNAPGGLFYRESFLGKLVIT